MLAFFQQHSLAVLTVGLALAVIAFTICIISKFFKLAVAIAILSVAVPVLFTIFWGDGTHYVEDIASCFQPKYQQQITDAYAYYKEKDNEDPLIDYDAVSEKVTNIFVKGQTPFPIPRYDGKESAALTLPDLWHR